jgi:hypothetical protein
LFLLFKVGKNIRTLFLPKKLRVVLITYSPLAIKLQAVGLLKQSLPKKLEGFLYDYIRVKTEVKEDTLNNILLNGFR